MSTVYLIPDDPLYDAVGFDVTNAENHLLTVTVTENPIEGGGFVNDHVITDPLVFSCETTTTESPTPRGDFYGDTGDISSEQRYDTINRDPFGLGFAIIPGTRIVSGVGRLDNAKSLVQAMYDRLVKLQQDRITMTVITTIREYENMLLVSIGLPRGELSIGAGRWALSFRQLEIVSTETVAAPVPSEPRGAKIKAKGAQSEKKAGEKASANIKSMAAGLLDGDFNLGDAAGKFFGVTP